jgi:ribosome-associated protein
MMPAMSDSDEEEVAESRRTIARRARRDAGVDSAKLANELMKLPASSLGKLGLDEDLRVDVDRARAVTATIARRRAERSLAGALRRVDLVALATRLENVRTTGVGDPRQLYQAERWRTRLLDEEGALAAFGEAFPTADHGAVARQIEAARKERSSGKPPGAGRALFRMVSAALDAAAAAASDADADDDDDEPADGGRDA